MRRLGETGNTCSFISAVDSSSGISRIRRGKGQWKRTHDLVDLVEIRDLPSNDSQGLDRNRAAYCLFALNAPRSTPEISSPVVARKYPSLIVR